MAKLDKKNILIIVMVAVVVAVAVTVGVLLYNSAQTKKDTESVKREANLILTSYKSMVIYSGLKVPSDSQIETIVPREGVETIKTVKTFGSPSTDSAVLKTGVKCDGSATKTGAAVRVLSPDGSEYCTD